MRDIEIVPAIKRIELKHVGCWENLCMEFIPGLNIITDDDRGLGKSTILRAIFKALYPLTPMRYSVSPTVDHKEGEISVELMSPNIAIRITGSHFSSAHTLRIPARKSNESQGQFMLKILRFFIEEAPPGIAILVEGDVIMCLDDNYYAESVKLLNSTRCQVICIIYHYRIDLNQFRQARIFACYRDQENDKASIRLRQSGGADS